MGAIARSPLHSRGSPRKRAKSELAASIPPSPWTDKRVELLQYPCILGGPKKGGKIRNWLPHSCLLGGPASAWKCYITPASSVVPNKLDKSELATSPPPSQEGGGGQVGRIAMTPLHSRGSPTREANSELATSPVPSWGPTSGRNCYVTHAFSVVSNKWDAIGIGCLTPAFSGAHKWAELLHQSYIIGCPQQRGHIGIGYLTPAVW